METACKKNNHTGKTKTWSLFTSSLHQEYEPQKPSENVKKISSLKCHSYYF